MHIIIATQNLFQYPIDCLLELTSKQIVVACSTGHISLYSINYATKTLNLDYKKPRCHSDTILSLCELDNNRLISSSNDKLIIIWKIFPKEIQLLSVIAAHSNYVYKISIMHDSNSFLSCSWDKTIKIWNSIDYKLITALNEYHWVYSCIHLKYNKHLIICSCAGKGLSYVSSWNINSKQRVSVFKDIHTNHSGGLLEVNKECLAVSKYGVIVLIDPINSIITGEIKDECITVASSLTLFKGRITYGSGGYLCLISLENKEIVFKRNVQKEFRGYYGVLNINNGKYLIADNNYKGFSIFEFNDINN
jgi:WD40 repeat protein